MAAAHNDVAIGQIALQAVEGRFFHNVNEFIGVLGAAGVQAGKFFLESLDKGIFDVLMQEKVVRGNTGLSAVEALAPGDAAGSQLEVGVLVHNARALAAQLQHHGREVLGLRLHGNASERRASGEENEVVAVLEQLSVHHAVALHHGYVLFGEGIGNHLFDDLGYVRDVGGGLEDGGAAGGDGAHKGVQEQLHGVVPGAHDERAAQRLPHNVAGRWQHGKGRRLAPAFCPAGKLADGFADFPVYQADLCDEGFFVALVEVFPQGFTEGGFPFA